MDKPTKTDYVAVPTHDIDHEEAAPPYKEQPINVQVQDDDSHARRKRFRFALIGGAVALLGLTQLCASGMDNYQALSENFNEMPPHFAPEPCALRHNENFAELKQHLESLDQQFNKHHRYNHWPQTDEAIEQFDHDRYDYGKHDMDNDFFAFDANNGDKKEHHRHHRHHHDKEYDEQIKEFGDWEPKHHHKHGKHLMATSDVDSQHYPFEPFCKPKDLKGVSTVYKFSPEEFKRTGIFTGGRFNRGSHIHLSKSVDPSIENVKVNVTIYSGRDSLQEQVTLSAFDHEGQYTVQVDRGHHFPGKQHEMKMKRGHHKEKVSNKEKEQDDDDDRHRREDCLIYDINVEFPANVSYYDEVLVHSSGALFTGNKDIADVEFGVVKAGLKRGAIIFNDGLKANKILLGILRGAIMGSYQASEKFSAGTVSGITKVNVKPTSDNINITASSVFGPASVDIPADRFKGDFALFNLLGEQSSVQAPNPEDIHVTKYRPTFKKGYYKEEHTGSKVVVAAKLHGGERLTFN